MVNPSHQPLIHVDQPIDPTDQDVSSPVFEDKTAYSHQPVFSDDAMSLLKIRALPQSAAPCPITI